MVLMTPTYPFLLNSTHQYIVWQSNRLDNKTLVDNLSITEHPLVHMFPHRSSAAWMFATLDRPDQQDRGHMTRRRQRSIAQHRNPGIRWEDILLWFTVWEMN